METTIDFNIIFDVPISMYHVSPYIYEPKLIKIGAMQESKYNTTMEKYKLVVVKKIIKDFFNNSSNEFLSYLVENSEEIANMYDYPNFYRTDAIAIDAAFIAWFIKPEEKNQIKFVENNKMTIMLDLILMKNQIPLELVIKIFNKTYDGSNQKVFFQSKFIALSPFAYARLSNDYTKNIHLLGCFYTSMVSEDTPQKSTQYQKLFNASKLQSYGIKFKAITDIEKPTFTSIQFDKTTRTLTLPRIVMHHERTEIVLKNLMAYEIAYSSSSVVKEYALFMDYLIDSVEDLQILIDAEIIENKMGSNENAVKLWNTLCIGITTEFGQKIAKIIDETHEHCNRLRYRLLKESYDRFFSRPWLVVSLITAIIITAATIIQAIYSVISYYPH